MLQVALYLAPVQSLSTHRRFLAEGSVYDDFQEAVGKNMPMESLPKWNNVGGENTSVGSSDGSKYRLAEVGLFRRDSMQYTEIPQVVAGFSDR